MLFIAGVLDGLLDHRQLTFKRSSRIIPLRTLTIAKVVACIGLSLAATVCRAQFTTIINVPPQVAPSSILSGTQLNLFDGGMLPGGFFAFDGEVNIFGGATGPFFSTHGVTNIFGGVIGEEMSSGPGAEVNLAGGSIGNFYRAKRGDVNVTGGSIGDAFVGVGIKLNVSGGEIGDNAAVVPETVVGEPFVPSEVTISGGRIGHNFQVNNFTYISGGAFGNGLQTLYDLSGSDFRIDGALIGGLENIGDVVTVNIGFDIGSFTSVLTGVFSDGTPFAFTRQNGDRRSGFDYLIEVTLRKTALPPIQPFRAVSAAAVDILGVREGEAILVDGSLGKHFNAGRGSAVEVVDGGSIGENCEAVAAIVNVRGGTIGGGFQAFDGTVVNISGGVIAGSLQSGGFQVLEGAVANISGGVIGALQGEGHVRISGGQVTITRIASAHFVIREFFVNGAPIIGLTLGEPTPVDISAGGVFSGTLADGTPFTQSLGGPTTPIFRRPIGILTVTLVPEPSGAALTALMIAAGAGAQWRRRR